MCTGGGGGGGAGGVAGAGCQCDDDGGAGDGGGACVVCGGGGGGPFALCAGGGWYSGASTCASIRLSTSVWRTGRRGSAFAGGVGGAKLMIDATDMDDAGRRRGADGFGGAAEATRRAATNDLEGRCKADSTLTPWDKMSWGEKLDLVRSFVGEADAAGLSAESFAEQRRVERGDPAFSSGCALM